MKNKLCVLIKRKKLKCKRNKSGIIFFNKKEMLISYIKLSNNSIFLINKDSSRLYDIYLNKPNFIFNNTPYYVFDINTSNQLKINIEIINEIINKLENG